MCVCVGGGVGWGCNSLCACVVCVPWHDVNDLAVMVRVEAMLCCVLRL